MTEHFKTCKKCVLHTHIPGITLNDNGLCPVCEHHEKFAPHEPKIKKYLFDEMENLFKSLKKQKRLYDVMVLFSGGKDSTFLLKMVKETYGLNPLAFSVIHPLVNHTATTNMEQVAKKLNVDLIKSFPDEQVFKKVIRYGITEGQKYGLGEFFGCDVCSFFHHWIPIRYAMKLGIPVILEGSDNSQLGEVTFWQGEKVKQDAKQGKKPYNKVHDLVIDALGEDYKGSIYDYNETEIIEGAYPTMISPFSFMDYDYRKNFKEIESLGLESKTFRSIYTNCAATPFFSYFSVKRFDCVSYIRHYATEIRKGYPNLMQRSLNDDNTAQVLNKDVILTLMNEYRNAVLYVAEHKLKPETITEQEKETLIGLAPTYIKTFGDNVCDVFLNDLLQINYFAEYFDVDLD
ncbi:MAG: hypothetical protein ACM3SY_07030 [Candidatus Omnitrophota bacterium]